ncbi:MAG: transporter substrate-binding domain-containing protein, partial [Hyphomicrobiales bacterium]|nr:transporter substrate-binding domain-containing protein [Hyphomicrobiales bacterium]
AAAAPLRIATREVPPFVMKRDGRLTGFSVDLWKAIAREAKLDYSFDVKDTLPDLIGAVGNGGDDAAIAAISVTAERDRAFDFSQPIFNAGVQIMARAHGADSLAPGFVAFFTSRGFLQLIAALLALVLVPAPLIFFLERRYETEEVGARTALGGFFRSLFWSASTFVGQTAGHPKSPIGRVIALAWMIIGVTFVSYFTAAVTSALTVQQLQTNVSGLSDLPGKRVATVAGSTSQAFLAAAGITAIPYGAVEPAEADLLAGKADAVVYDAPVLLYFASHDGAGRAELVGGVLKPEDYGILFPRGSPLRRDVDAALLRLKESGEYARIYARYFTRAGGG